MNDIELHSAALAYANDKCVNYAEALGCVVELAALHQESVRFSAMSSVPTDAQLDLRARVYAREHGVAYSEAIGTVCGVSDPHGIARCVMLDAQISSFSEAVSIDSPSRAIEGQMIEIFRAGQHVADTGNTLHFSAQDIHDIADTYSPKVREAPLVIGHPTTDMPAQGWVKGLSATDDGRLLMASRQVAPDFAQMVKEGRYKKRSASFYPPNHPSNPAPGKWYLRHVGWLGAHQPAIAGLKDVSI